MSAETTYPGVLHRKARGSLVLTDRGLLFRPEGGGGAAGGAGGGAGTAAGAGAGGGRLVLPWSRVAKHQVSPASHPKAMLKVVAAPAPAGGGGDGGDGGGGSHTFAFPDRASLERARRDVSRRLSGRKDDKKVGAAAASAAGAKRPRDAASSSSAPDPPSAHRRLPTPPSSRYVDLDPVALVATRSSLLASDPALRAQHRLLVLDGGALSEEDFWDTHARLVADEYARISGRTDRGTGSDIKSSLDLGLASASKKKGGGGKDAKAAARSGVVRLGVEEMRQIFAMYPAVHRAYEEKVPLELSEEQFWRRYLESEYFHRDRGRIGAHVGKVNERELAERERLFGKNHAGEDGADESGGKKKDHPGKKDDEAGGMAEDEAKSRLAAAGTDDIFSRYDPEGGRPAPGGVGDGARRGHPRRARRRGAHRPPGHPPASASAPLAAGQFDLASTHGVERGARFLAPGRDLHPPPERDSAGARVVGKYNRHWAVVLAPDATARGADSRAGAGGGTAEAEDAAANGGCDREMRRLVGFADAGKGEADLSRGTGGEDDDLVDLTLKNVDAYAGKFGSDVPAKGGTSAEVHLKYARYLAAAIRADAEPILRERRSGRARGYRGAPTLKHPFPDPKIGRGLLEALTKKMVSDSKTEADVQRLAEDLPEEFRTKLATFFRRASELLRHFFSLRAAFNADSDGNGGVGPSASQRERLTGIVEGMERVHGEMYELTRNLDPTEAKMFRPIMDQLDHAFKLHREDGSRGGGRGGFVTVTKGGFVPVA